jgi:hypothetical protein
MIERQNTAKHAATAGVAVAVLNNVVTSVSSASISRSFCLNAVFTGRSKLNLAFTRSWCCARILSASSVVCVFAFVDPRTERSIGPL